MSSNKISNINDIRKNKPTATAPKADTDTAVIIPSVGSVSDIEYYKAFKDQEVLDSIAKKMLNALDASSECATLDPLQACYGLMIILQSTFTTLLSTSLDGDAIMKSFNESHTEQESMDAFKKEREEQVNKYIQTATDTRSLIANALNGRKFESTPSTDIMALMDMLQASFDILCDVSIKLALGQILPQDGDTGDSKEVD